MELTVPHDLDAERAVLGAALVNPAVIGEAVWMLGAGDFYTPKHQAIFAAVAGFHERGETWDGRAVLNACAASGEPVEAVDITDLMAGATAGWRHHADRLVDLAARRQVVYASSDAIESAGDLRLDVGEVVDATRARLERAVLPGSRIPDTLHTADQVADRPTDQAPWVIDGMLRQGWRCVVVGTEGGGKSMLLLQCALLASAGIHPLHYRPIKPAVVLLVDLENPDDAVTERVRKMRTAVLNQRGDWDATRPWIWEEPAGIDLRSRRHHGEMDAICSQVRPDLVCLGPVYKSYEKRAGERGHEDGVRHLQSILDDLRTRHRFALLLEHHAPLDASNGASAKRTFRPSDTMLWLRWPEIGIGLTPDDERPKTVMHCRRWRGDRVKSAWPDRIEYGQTFPWAGVWNEAPI